MTAPFIPTPLKAISQSQHCGHNHLNRYLAEFDFRYNNRVALGTNDTERAEKLLLGFKGKRLTYERTN